MQVQGKQSSYSYLLSEALSLFVQNMDNAIFRLVVVDEQGLIAQLYGSLSFPKKYKLSKGQNWTMIADRIQWEDKAKEQGIISLGKSAYNLVKYNNSADIDLPFKIYLISSIDIDLPWLNMAVSAIHTSINAQLKGASMQKQMEDTDQFTFAMMNALKIGVISVSTKGEIKYANNLACQWINIRRRELLEIPIKKLINKN